MIGRGGGHDPRDNASQSMQLKSNDLETSNETLHGADLGSENKLLGEELDDSLPNSDVTKSGISGDFGSPVRRI